MITLKITKFFDALFCYYYVVCKEKVWFAHDSFYLYAIAFASGASAFILGLNALAFLNIVGVIVNRDGIPEFGISNFSLLTIFYLCMLLFMLFLCVYLKKENKSRKLIKELKSHNYQLTKASIWIGRIYKVAIILPIVLAWLPTIIDSLYS